MARTQKDIVSYFPHDANATNSDTLTVLQSRFGNDGYAFWFKLLEKLAATEGHCLDVSNQTKWHLLLARTGVNAITGVEIMKLLVEMQAIDKDLWESKLIWCQNLVNNLSDVYKNRRREIPQIPISTNHNGLTTEKKALTTGVSTQSKVKESKVKESKVKESKVKESKVDNTILPEWIDKDTWDAFLEMRKKIRSVPTEYAKGLLVKKLQELRDAGDNPNEVLKRSIMNGWKGVFPLDKKGSESGTHRQSPTKLIPRDSYTRPEDF